MGAVPAEVGQYADGDADTGRGQGAADEERDHRREAEEIITGAAADNERQDETGNGDDYRLRPGLDESLHVGFQADLEQQQDDADFRQQPERVARQYPAQQARTDDDTGTNLADDRRRTEPHRELAEEAC